MQTYFGARELLEYLESYLSKTQYLFDDSETVRRVDLQYVARLTAIQDHAAKVLNTLGVDNPLDTETLSECWHNNRHLRAIYEERFRDTKRLTFDEWVNIE